MNIKAIDVINSISCFQLAFFTVILIHIGKKNTANLTLAVFFIIQFIVIGIALLSNFLVGENPHLYADIFIFGLPFWFLFGPLMNLYIRSLVLKDFRIHLKEIIHLIPFIAGAIYIISQYYIMSSDVKELLISSGAIYKQLTIWSIIQNLQVLIYNVFSLITLIHYQQELKNYCSIFEKRNLIWLKIVLYGYLVPCVIAELNSFVGDIIPISYDNQLLITYSAFLVFFNILFYKAMLHPYVIVQPREKEKYSTSNLSNSDILKYSKIIEEYVYMKKPFLNPALTLSELSDSLGVPEKYISQVLNQHWKQNFYTFINTLRIEEAKKLLVSEAVIKNTMFGIAFDSGFNSKTVFYEAFKKYVGMTPADYRKQNQ